MGFKSFGIPYKSSIEVELVMMPCVVRIQLNLCILRLLLNGFGGVIGSIWFDGPCASKVDKIVLILGSKVVVLQEADCSALSVCCHLLSGSMTEPS